MWFKFFVAVIMLTSLKFFFKSFSGNEKVTDTIITQEWWDGLSEEWKTILIINQNFQKQGVDIFKIQNEYINRSNEQGDADLSEINSSLYELNGVRRFALGYSDFYKRAIRTNHVVQNDRIELATLGQLQTMYMVNGPKDLSPLVKFPHLKILIMNYCGIEPGGVTENNSINLEPLAQLRDLRVLHCSYVALKSLDPIKDLPKLEELFCENTGITNLTPLKNSISLKKLSCGSEMLNASAVSHLSNLEELYLRGCKELPNLSRLKKLRALFVAENELALVKSSYRLENIDFLKSLSSLEFLDLKYTSYRGSIDILYNLSNLKAVTLPLVKRNDVLAFKEHKKDCRVINLFEFE
jgi:hypothetical protein